MELIYLVYGLAFFLLGFAILLYPKKGSALEMSRSIKLIAYFGILHGINEWLDLLIIINYLSDPYPLKVMRMITLPVSFIFLILFGAKVLRACSKQPCACRFFNLFLLAVWIIVFLAGERTMMMWDIWSRYILCLPGAFLTGLALLLYVPQVEPARVNKITQNLKFAGFAFMAYAILAGAIVQRGDFFPASFLNYDSFERIFGVPVQVFRSICAVVIAYCLIRVLGIFHWEIKKDLFESRTRFAAVANQTPVILFTTDRYNNITFIEGKGLINLDLAGKDLTGRSTTEVFGDSKEVTRCLELAMGNSSSATTFKVKDRILQLFGGPIMDRGHIDGAIGVVIDITTESKANAELNDYREKMLQQKTLAELGTLGTEMVQKLSTPVASIKACLLTALMSLRKMPNNLNLRKPLENSLEQSSEAMDIIDKFFNFANITPKPKAEPIDIELIVNRVLAVFRDRINRAMLRVETSGIDIVPCMCISSHEIEQIFFNIVQNAVQSASGDKVGDFSIKCDLVESSLRIEFRDNLEMSGFEDLNDIFEPFTSAHAASQTASLGLVVIKRLVMAYNGTIEARRQGDLNIIEISMPVENL